MVTMAGGVSGRTDPFPGPAPLPRHRVKRFLRGTEEKPPRPVAPRLRWHLKNLENQEKSAAEKAARWEPLLPEEPGFLEPDPGQDPCTITQREIADSVDIASASKHFDLRLEQFGPYRVDYTRNGRFLLLGGARGHVAALDWSSRRLSCEFNVMEPIRDLRWLHSESLLAVAQRRWLHVYDSQGLEIHVVRRFQGILRMEFLPYHFLLAAVSELGLLHFLDISVGQEVTSLRTRSGRATAMAQNPQSALIHLGHGNGTVSLWSPNVPEAVSRILAHRAALRGVAVDATGRLMATSGLDQKIRIFDLRTFGVLQEWKSLGASEVNFSQRGVLAAAMGDIVQLFPQLGSASPPNPFLQHKTPKAPLALRFCPFEDVLGAGHGLGFTSILVPGSGEPNLDALENNPYRSRKQRQEWEVKALLEKIPAELLTADPSLLSQVDTAGLEQKHQERVQRLGFDPNAKAKFQPRRRHKGRNCERRKRQVRHEESRALIKQSLEKKEKEKKEREKIQEEPPKKRRKKDGKIPQKLGEKPQKKEKKLGEKPQKIGEEKGEKSQKKQKKMGENPQKIGEKPKKIGKKKVENPKKKGKKKKGSSVPKLGEKTPKLGFSLPKKGALERFRK